MNSSNTYYTTGDNNVIHIKLACEVASFRGRAADRASASCGRVRACDSRCLDFEGSELEIALETSGDHLRIQDSSGLSTKFVGSVSRKACPDWFTANPQTKNLEFRGFDTNYLSCVKWISPERIGVPNKYRLWVTSLVDASMRESAK